MSDPRPLPGRVVFISDSLPADHIGSHVLFRRHLARLADSGWDVIVAGTEAPPPNDTLMTNYQRVPYRRWWWPPVRRNRWDLVRLRQWLQSRELLQRIPPSSRATVVLANLWDDLALIAACVSRRSGWKLGVFVHDNELVWHADSTPLNYLRRKRAEVCAQAARLWSVSNALAATLDPETRSRCRVLRPIPGSYTLPVPEWQTDFARGPRVGYAGKMYGNLQPLLRELARVLQSCGGALEILTDPANAQLLHQSEPNLHAHPFLPSAEAAAAWLRARCSALLVPHPLSFRGVEPHWQTLRSSFPSKLPEFAQLGLPLVIIAENDSELGVWARARPGVPFFSSLAGPQLPNYFRSLREQNAWQSASARTRQIAAEEFDPDVIQAQFERDLFALAHGAAVLAPESTACNRS